MVIMICFLQISCEEKENNEHLYEIHTHHGDHTHHNEHDHDHSHIGAHEASDAHDAFDYELNEFEERYGLYEN